MNKDPVVVVTAAALEEREERWTDEVLEAAAERLRFGWTQGTFGEPLSGKRQWKADAASFAFCVLGALSHAAEALGADVYTLRKAERLVAETIRSDGWRGPGGEAVLEKYGPRKMIATWNDEPGRSK